MIYIYITGALLGLGATGHQQLTKAKQKLVDKGYGPKFIATAAELTEVHNHEDAIEVFAERLCEVLTRKIILTLDNYDQDVDSELEVHIARKKNIQVVPFNKFYHDYTNGQLSDYRR